MKDLNFSILVLILAWLMKAKKSKDGNFTTSDCIEEAIRCVFREHNRIHLLKQRISQEL